MRRHSSKCGGGVGSFEYPAPIFARVRSSLPLIATGLVLLAPGGAQAARPLGTLTQLGGSAGCVSFSGIDGTGGSTCATGTEVIRPDAPAVSPDGGSLYVGTYGTGEKSKGPDGLAIFARNQSTGAISQLPGKAGCITEDGSSEKGAGTCTSARGISSPDGLPPAFTRDGRFVYYASQGENEKVFPGAVAVFARDPSSGALTQLAGTAGCVSQDGSSPSGDAGSCGVAPSIDGPVDVVLSPDERFLYVYSYDSSFPGITIFSRDPSTGALTLVPGAAGCLTKEGKSAAGPGTCTALRGGTSSDEGQGFAISPDGRFAYETEYESSGATVQLFSRDPSTGQLTQLPGVQGCISDTGASAEGANTCTQVHGIEGAYVLALSPDGSTLVVGAYDNGLAIFRRDSGTGLLTQLAGAAGCISDNAKNTDDPSQPCLQANASRGAYRLQFGPEGRTLLQASVSDSGIQLYTFDAASGTVTPVSGKAGCVTYNGEGASGKETCEVGRGLHETYGLSISPDGAYVYAVGDSKEDGGIAVFSRSAAPICGSFSATIPFATPTPLTPPCHDPNGDPFTVQALSAPAHGTLSASGGSFAFGPAAGFSGADSFAFEATGEKGPSLPASATLTVGPPPRAAMAFGKVSNSAGVVSVPIRCLTPGAACNGPISLKARLPVTVVVVKKAKHGKKHKIKRKVVKNLTVASGRISVLAGSTKTYKLRLSKAALARLLSQHRLALSIKVTLSEPTPPAGVYTKSFTAKVKVKKHKKHHR